MKALLNRLFEHEKLSEQEAYEVLSRIGNGEFNSGQIVSFLTVYNMRTVTVEELTGFRNAMLDLCLKIDLSDYNTIDIVGTGGDGKDTFNISTCSSFVVAGAGMKVAKHGNYGVSSSSGSSNVLEYLGVPFTNDESKLNQMLDKAGFCMMHAPLFHPAMKHVAPARKEMQVRTIFNVLGPIVNPSNPNNQLLGTFNLELQRLYAYLTQNSSNNFSIAHALDGYDEISLTSGTKVISNKGEYIYEAKDFAFQRLRQKQLEGGGSVKSAAQIFVNILEGKATEAQANVVIANSALAIQTVMQNKLEDAITIAKESIDSGKAKQVLAVLKKFN